MTANGGSQISTSFVGIRFSDDAPPCPDDLAIIVTLQAVDEEDFTVSLTSDGVELNFVPPADLYSAKYISPVASDAIVLLSHDNRQGAVHAIDLPAKQELLIGELPMDMTLVIEVLRIERKRTVLTNRAIVDLGMGEPSCEQSPEFLSSSRKSWKFKAPSWRHTVKTIALVLLALVAIVIVTPLSFVHANQPQSESGSLAVVWSAGRPSVGQEAVIAMSDHNVFIGTVAQVDGNNFIVESTSSFAPATIDNYLGRVLFSIPLLGELMQ